MSISPRKSEVDAVVALLESDQFDTSTSMAKELIKQVADILSNRDTLGVHAFFESSTASQYSHPAGGLAIGPFYDKRSADKCAADAREAGMEARVARLSGTGSIRAAQALRQVCVCGHRTEAHVWTTCTIKDCDCKGVTYNE